MSCQQPERRRSEKLALWVAALAQVIRLVWEAVSDGRL